MGKKTIFAPEASKQKRVSEINEPEVKENDSSVDQETPEHKRALNRAELRKQFITVASQLAQSNFCFRNYKYQGADQMFPRVIDAHQRFVDKCFPHAKGGLLLVDEPQNERQIELAQAKHEKLLQKGFRHVIIIDGETTLDECYEQLGE